MSYGLLKGKKGIIFGALNDQSIAWKVAERCHEEGAEFILSNAPIAMRMGEIDELAAKTGSDVIPADATSVEDLEKLFAHAQEKFGKIDFILHSIGMSVNIRKVMKAAWDKDIMNEWGSILALTYIAAQRTFPNYGDMADNKSYLESIARSFGYYWGERKVRVNTISQSPVMTKAGAGVKGINGFFNFADSMSPLGNADAMDCANYCVSLFSDLTRKVTMQNLFHDGGFSNTGVSQKIVDKFEDFEG